MFTVTVSDNELGSILGVLFCQIGATANNLVDDMNKRAAVRIIFEIIKLGIVDFFIS